MDGIFMMLCVIKLEVIRKYYRNLLLLKIRLLRRKLNVYSAFFN